MKRAVFATISMFVVSVLTSCESTNQHRGGGAAFEDSILAPKLDANSHLDDPEIPGKRSYEQWRNGE